MKDTKTERYHGRISPTTKARWTAFSSEQGYRGLASMIEDAVEEKIERGQDAADPAEAPPKPDPATNPYPNGVEREVKSDFKGAKKKGCPNEAKHRKGIYCKACRKVVR